MVEGRTVLIDDFIKEVDIERSADDIYVIIDIIILDTTKLIATKAITVRRIRIC